MSENKNKSQIIARQKKTKNQKKEQALEKFLLSFFLPNTRKNEVSAEEDNFSDPHKNNTKKDSFSAKSTAKILSNAVSQIKKQEKEEKAKASELAKQKIAEEDQKVREHNIHFQEVCKQIKKQRKDDEEFASQKAIQATQEIEKEIQVLQEKTSNKNVLLNEEQKILIQQEKESILHKKGKILQIKKQEKEEKAKASELAKQKIAEENQKLSEIHKNIEQKKEKILLEEKESHVRISLKANEEVKLIEIKISSAKEKSEEEQNMLFDELKEEKLRQQKKWHYESRKEKEFEEEENKKLQKLSHKFKEFEFQQKQKIIEIRENEKSKIYNYAEREKKMLEQAEKNLAIEVGRLEEAKSQAKERKKVVSEEGRLLVEQIKRRVSHQEKILKDVKKIAKEAEEKVLGEEKKVMTEMKKMAEEEIQSIEKGGLMNQEGMGKGDLGLAAQKARIIAMEEEKKVLEAKERAREARKKVLEEERKIAEKQAEKLFKEEEKLKFAKEEVKKVQLLITEKELEVSEKEKQKILWQEKKIIKAREEVKIAQRNVWEEERKGVNSTKRKISKEINQAENEIKAEQEKLKEEQLKSKKISLERAQIQKEKKQRWLVNQDRKEIDIQEKQKKISERYISIKNNYQGKILQIKKQEKEEKAKASELAKQKIAEEDQKVREHNIHFQEVCKQIKKQRKDDEEFASQKAIQATQEIEKEIQVLQEKTSNKNVLLNEEQKILIQQEKESILHKKGKILQIKKQEKEEKAKASELAKQKIAEENQKLSKFLKVSHEKVFQIYKEEKQAHNEVIQKMKECIFQKQKEAQEERKKALELEAKALEEERKKALEQRQKLLAEKKKKKEELKQKKLEEKMRIREEKVKAQEERKKALELEAKALEEERKKALEQRQKLLAEKKKKKEELKQKKLEEKMRIREEKVKAQEERKKALELEAKALEEERKKALEQRQKLLAEKKKKKEELKQKKLEEKMRIREEKVKAQEERKKQKEEEKLARKIEKKNTQEVSLWKWGIFGQAGSFGLKNDDQEGSQKNVDKEGGLKKEEEEKILRKKKKEELKQKKLEEKMRIREEKVKAQEERKKQKEMVKTQSSNGLFGIFSKKSKTADPKINDVVIDFTLSEEEHKKKTNSKKKKSIFQIFSGPSDEQKQMKKREKEKLFEKKKNEKIELKRKAIEKKKQKKAETKKRKEEKNNSKKVQEKSNGILRNIFGKNKKQKQKESLLKIKDPADQEDSLLKKKGEERMAGLFQKSDENEAYIGVQKHDLDQKQKKQEKSNDSEGQSTKKVSLFSIFQENKSDYEPKEELSQSNNNLDSNVQIENSRFPSEEQTITTENYVFKDSSIDDKKENISESNSNQKSDFTLVPNFETNSSNQEFKNQNSAKIPSFQEAQKESLEASINKPICNDIHEKINQDELVTTNTFSLEHVEKREQETPPEKILDATPSHVDKKFDNPLLFNTEEEKQKLIELSFANEIVEENTEEKSQEPNRNTSGLSFGSVIKPDQESHLENSEAIGYTHDSRIDQSQAENLSTELSFANPINENISQNNSVEKDVLATESLLKSSNTSSDRAGNPFSQIFGTEEASLNKSDSDPQFHNELGGDSSLKQNVKSEVQTLNQQQEEQEKSIQNTSGDGQGNGSSIHSNAVQKTGEASTVSISSEENGLVTNIVQGVQVNQVPPQEEESPSILGGDFADNMDLLNSKEEIRKKNRRKSHFLAIARFLFVISLLVPASSMLIFSIILDSESGIANKIQAKNYGKILVMQQEKNKEKKEHIGRIKEETREAQARIASIKDNKVLTKIIENRVDFLGIMLKINGITLESLNLTPEINRTIQMLVFNSYSGSIDSKGNVKINISGSVRDPRRMSLTKLTELMETINEDRYFDGASLRSFSKTDDREGGSRSSFAFNITYDPSLDDETLLSDAGK